MASDDDDPRAPYKVYEGDECKGNYPTRAEARRAQQRLESEATGSELPRNFIIMDNVRDRPLRLSGHGGSSRNMRGDRKPPIASSSAVRSRAAP